MIDDPLGRLPLNPVGLFFIPFCSSVVKLSAYVVRAQRTIYPSALDEKNKNKKLQIIKLGRTVSICFGDFRTVFPARITVRDVVGLFYVVYAVIVGNIPGVFQNVSTHLAARRLTGKCDGRR